MFEEFLHNIHNQRLFQQSDKILLAISGGIDSMVMAHLFSEAGFHFGFAHCNFQLRGLESNQDEKFVKKSANTLKSPFFSKNFDTEAYAKKKKISVQMAARELRYGWFEKIRNENKYDYIALAHNKDDLIETLLINLIRGTGIRGLSGMKVKQGKIIRPLLFASRSMINEYQKINKIKYREDSSNESVKYARNRIRHQVIPELEKLNPAFKTNISQTILHLEDVRKIFAEVIDKKRSELVRIKEGKTLIDIDKLKKLDHIGTYLYEFLRPFRFPHQIIPDIIASLSTTPGKQFFSITHRLIRDRAHLIITLNTEIPESNIYIDKDSTEVKHPIHLVLKKIKITPEYKFSESKLIASLDLDLLKFPLILRRWKSGDQFQPLGMKNKKKVSDFFINNKFSIPEKESAWILESDSRIVWIVGYRIDDRFKITLNTRNILQIEHVKTTNT